MVSDQAPEFPYFWLLPADIQANIFARVVRKMAATPSAYVINITRSEVDPVTEAQVVAAVTQWKQDPPDPRREEVVTNHFRHFAARKHRATLVNISVDQDRQGVAKYGAQWRINELAAVNKDASECVTKEMVRLYGDPTRDDWDTEMVQASGQDCKFLTLLGPDDLVVLKGPEAQTCKDFRFFALNNRCEGVVNVASNAELGLPGPPVVYSWEDRPNPRMDQICQPLTGLKHLAFLYHEDLDGVEHATQGCASFIGLRVVAKAIFPKLEVLYLLGESIKIKRSKQPAPGTRSFAGLEATFYQVNRNDSAWDIPKRKLGPTYECHKDYCWKTPLEVLACVPHTSQGWQGLTEEARRGGLERR